MGAAVHQFHVGNFSCMTILDGIGRYPPGMFFTNLRKEQYEPQLLERGQSSEQMDIPIICLLIKTERARVLVDTGAGSMVPGAGQLFQHLRAAGVEPREIDTVVLSHAHGDHIAGNLMEDGTPAFRNARYVIFKKEWDFWMSRPSLAEWPFDASVKEAVVAFVGKNLAGIQAQVDLIEPETEILPGLSALSAFGHTPGHMALEISSAGERCLFAADAIIDPIDVECPEARAVVDHLPDEMVRTRLRILDRAATERMLLSASHFPFPGLGRVLKSGKGWQWQPV